MEFNNYNLYKIKLVLYMKEHSDCSSKACIDKPDTSIIDPHSESGSLAKATQMEIYYPSRQLYRTEIGRISWRLFHRFSVLCNMENEEEKKHMKNFIKGLSLFFPCPTCKEDFKVEIAKKPYDGIFNSNSSTELINWVCYQHNQVNEKLSKPLFDCNTSKIKKDYTF